MEFINDGPGPGEPRKQDNPHAVALGRLGGQAKSLRKTLASRENARLPRGRKLKSDAADSATMVSDPARCFPDNTEQSISIPTPQH